MDNSITDQTMLIRHEPLLAYMRLLPHDIRMVYFDLVNISAQKRGRVARAYAIIRLSEHVDTSAEQAENYLIRLERLGYVESDEQDLTVSGYGEYFAMSEDEFVVSQ